MMPKHMNELFPSISALTGIQILPSEDIRNGYKWTAGDTIYISPGNYALLRPMTAWGTIHALGLLQEQKEQSGHTIDLLTLQ